MSAPAEKHLEMIQAVVSRLSSNSFAYKGWTVTVAAGLIAFLVGKESRLLPAGLYPIIAFWFLDSHSLSLERAFRRLYDASRLGRSDAYSMSIQPYRKPIRDQINSMLSLTQLTFYLSTGVCVYIIQELHK
jgi:hypothetical protein